MLGILVPLRPAMIPAIAVPSVGNPLEVPEKFTLYVLGAAEQHSCAARGVKLVGRRLIAQISEYLKPNECVRIDCDDAFVVGEVLGCWREGSTIFTAIDLQQAMTGLAELCRTSSGIQPVEARQIA